MRATSVEYRQMRRLWFWFWILIIAVAFWFWPGFGTRLVELLPSPANPAASSLNLIAHLLEDPSTSLSLKNCYAASGEPIGPIARPLLFGARCL